MYLVKELQGTYFGKLVVSDRSESLTSFCSLCLRNLQGLSEITEVLKETSEQANDAETIAHDALASINARADEITASMAGARRLQDDYAEMRFSVDATRKALADIDASSRAQLKRRRRQTEDALAEAAEADAEAGRRLGGIGVRADNIERMKDGIEDLLVSVKARLTMIRGNISQ